jgi:YVTN family beta-propeller protein
MQWRSSGDGGASDMAGNVGGVSDTAPSGPEPSGSIVSGTIFAGYRIEAEIGRGGMGVVYRARHLALDRERALKVISPALSTDPHFRERFQREARLAASLEHPNIVPVDHAGDEGGVLYLSMRLVEGSDLRRIVEAEGPLDARRASQLLAGVAAGLDAAHERGLLHRDVKPANVLVEGVDGEERAFLTDFGISRIAGGGGTVTASGELLGSPDYVAPEQVAGDRVDYRTDVYALGCLLHFALTGQPPFPRDNDLAKLFAHANAPRPRPSELVPGLPTALDGVVARAMAIRPEYRYESAAELAADVESIVGGAEPVVADAPPPPLPATEEAPTRRLPRSRGRRTGAIVAGCVALAVAGGVAALLLRGGKQGGGSASSGPLAVATVQVGRGPTGLAVSPARLWVASSGASALYAIDLATNRQSRPPVPAGGDPVSVAVAFDSIWALNRDSGTLLRLEHLNRSAPIEIPVGANPSDVTFDKHWVWVANQGDDTVSRIDPETNQVDATVDVDSGPSGIATGAGAVWVTNAGGDSVSKIDPGQAKVVGKPIPIGQRPSELAVGHGSVWVTDLSKGTVTRIHARSMKVGDPIKVGDRPSAVAIGVGYVWVANGGDSTVSRIDPRAAALAGPPIPVGGDPADVAVAMGAVWTANLDDSTVTRIRP